MLGTNVGIVFGCCDATPERAGVPHGLPQPLRPQQVSREQTATGIHSFKRRARSPQSFFFFPSPSNACIASQNTPRLFRPHCTPTPIQPTYNIQPNPTCRLQSIRTALSSRHPLLPQLQPPDNLPALHPFEMHYFLPHDHSVHSRRS